MLNCHNSIIFLKKDNTSSFLFAYNYQN